MCCTSGKAKLSNTILYANAMVKDGKLIHILGYQNTVENLESGPNAMILPLPAKSTVGPDNIIDTTEYKDCLKKMARIIANGGVGYRRMTKSASRSEAQVFDSGEYTVVLSQDSHSIYEALQIVPENKKPNISKEILEAYNQWYPDWPIAVCCFEATEMEASPLLWWYEPLDDSKLFLPALDGHGTIPNLNKNVMVDHTLIIGSEAEHAYLTRHDIYIDNLIKYNLIKYNFSAENSANQIRQYLPSKILGRKIKGRYKNGDFYVTTKEDGNLKIDRLNPTEMISKIVGE